MRFSVSRVGALAPAALVFMVAFAASETGASARNQSLPEQALPFPAAVTAQEAEAEIRFVPGEVVQQTTIRAALDEAEPDEAEYRSLDELVLATNIATEPTGELQCLAQAIYFEARGEPLSGQLAVAQVVINRAEHARFPSGYCAVVRQPYQFSFVRGGQIPSPNTSSASWARAKAIASIAHEGQWQSEAGDALYFHARNVRPSWTHAKTQRATIDRHIFYR